MSLAIPDLPKDIREDYVVSAAIQLQRQARWLFAALFITAPIAIFAAGEHTHWLVKWGLPSIMGIYCLYGFAMLSRKLDFETNPRRAAKFVVEASVSSCFGAIICSLWCVLSWHGAEGEQRLHFPMILVMGALATAYCLASIRLGAILNLVIDLTPISLLLLFSGSAMDFAAGVSLILSGVFQWWMINTHHRQVLELLRLKRHSQNLALTDPLTGLLNRRALLDFAEALGTVPGTYRMLLIDIDFFKAINDRHGHDMGDQVLAEIARLIQLRSGNNVSAARLGGEEFALLGTREALPEAVAVALVSEIRSHLMPHGDQVTVSIGIAEGELGQESHWRALFSRADVALYRAKNGGRNLFCYAEEAEHDENDTATHIMPARIAGALARAEREGVTFQDQTGLSTGADVPFRGFNRSSTTTTNWSGSNGFLRYSVAPVYMAIASSLALWRPVSISTGVRYKSWLRRIAASTSIPPISGRPTSRMTRSGFLVAIIWSADFPSPTIPMACPSSARVSMTNWPTSSSSSTYMIRAMTVFLKRLNEVSGRRDVSPKCQDRLAARQFGQQ
nr:diguanylate cyclase [Qipengyuania marisflavi]